VLGESLRSGLLAEVIVDCIRRDTIGSRDIGGGGAGSSWLCCLPEYSSFSQCCGFGCCTGKVLRRHCHRPLFLRLRRLILITTSLSDSSEILAPCARRL
jgi:hypothetical protein